MKNRNPNKIEDEIEELMFLFHSRIFSEMKTESLKSNLNVSQIEVLRYVMKQKNPTMRDIANHLMIKPPSVTAILESLSEKKLLKKEIDKKDKRITRVIVTQKAIKKFNLFRSKKLLIIKDIFSGISKKDEEELIRILSVVKNINHEK